MDAETIARLNAINRQFYAITAAEFDQTRGQPWPGWSRLLPHLPAAEPLRVFDLGCGNGRFGLFLRASYKGTIAYHGQDNSPELLAFAHSALADQPQMTVRLTEADLLDGLPDAEYDMIGLFGVLHHVPSHEQRRYLLRELAHRLAPGGLLAFACWRFMDYERFQKRLAPWPDALDREPGDHLLDWRRGEHALRYCHHVDDAEHAQLIAATGCDVVADYRADGFSGAVNRYTLLRC